MDWRQKKYQLILKFLFLYTAFTVVLGMAFAAVFYFNFVHNAQDHIRQHAMDNAISISQTVDFRGHETLQNPADMSTPAYQRIFSDLNFATEILPEVSYVYTMRPMNDDVWEFVVDATVEEDSNGNGRIDDDEAQALIGEEYEVSKFPELTKGWYGPSADTTVTHDVWGDWISGYAPIKDETGRTVGIVGVDISADELIAEKILIIKLIALALAITTLLSMLVAAIGIFITSEESKCIQDALRIRNRDLESLVRKRTDALKKFIMLVVHEMRAPLTSLKWGLENLRQQKKRSTAEREQIVQMEIIINDQLDLISRLLDASHVGLQKLPVEKRLGRLPDLAKQVTEEFRAQAEHKGLTLSYNSQGRIPKISYDEKRLRQVLTNFISNAIKYTQKGSVQVKLNLAGKKRVRVSVTDTGCGISETDQALLFQPFTRLGKSREPGSGLGLVIAKGIIQAHGGRLGLDSKVGQGSTFWFEIPIK